MKRFSSLRSSKIENSGKPNGKKIKSNKMSTNIQNIQCSHAADY